MKDYIKAQYEFDLLNTIKFLLRKWLIILIAGVLCSGIVGGYKYLSSNTTSNETTEMADNTTADYNDLLASYTSSQNELDTAIQYIYDSINYQNQYFNNSIIYRIDSNETPTTMLGYELLITANDYANSTDTIFNYYLYGIANGDYLNQLAIDIGTEPQYLNEIIIVDKNVGSFIQPADDSEYVISCALTITINGLDESMCNTIADRVSEEADNLYKNDPRNSQYSMTPIYRTFAYVHSSRVMSAQQTANNNYDALFGKLKNYSGYKNNISAPINTDGGSDGTKSIIKYSVIGFLLGIVISCVVLVLKYIFDYKVSGISQFKCRYNVSDLGSSSAMIATNIKLALNDRTTIVFSGTVDKTEATKIIDAIEKDLDGYNLIEATDILNDPNQRLKLSQSNDIVLIEQKGKSLYSNIDEELKVLSCMNKNVIGIVLI